MRFIGHELRTPLNSVFMGLPLSIDQIPEDIQEPVEVERRETLVETQSACGAALDILNELLLFDKLETGALVLHKQSVPVSELVEDSVKIFTAQAREKSVELSITNNDEAMLESTEEGDGEAQLALYESDEVAVDKNKVVQVIRNVVSNAIKFTPASGKIQVNLKFEPELNRSAKPKESPRVGLCCKFNKYMPGNTTTSDNVAIDVGPTPDSRDIDNERLVSGELIIEIRDSGAGISEENQRRLFKEVVQFNPELLQNGGGSGLGMCISKGIMDMHGGSIGVRSPGEGQGSVFTLRLPIVRVKDHGSVYVPAHIASHKVPSAMTSSKSITCTQVVEIKHSDSVDIADDGCSSTSPPQEHAFTLLSQRTVATERPLHFLVVDDSKMNRKMLCRLLQNKGHDCTEAEDGVQAVAMVTAILAKLDSTSQGAEALEGLDTMNSPFADVGASGAYAYDAILMDFM